MSQIFHQVFSFNFMLKNGKLIGFVQTELSTFDKTKTQTYIKNLRHGSLHMNLICEDFVFLCRFLSRFLSFSVQQM